MFSAFKMVTLLHQMAGKYALNLLNTIRRTSGPKLMLHKNQAVTEEKRKQLMAKGLPTQKPINGVKDIIIVASGKGGVGKSTVSVNLAIALKQNNLRKEVGLLDADIFGPCVPLMLNINDKPLTNHETKMVPLRNWGIKCISMGMLMEKNQAIVWRGLMVMQAIDNLIRHVDWGVVDYLVIDTPPGTGDTHLSILQSIPISAVVMVTTPQKPSLEVTARSIAMFKKMKVNIAGVVSNMSEIVCSNCGHNSIMYGTRVADFCETFGVPVLANIPMEKDIGNSGDCGKPIVVTTPDGRVGKEFKAMAASIENYLVEIKKKSDDISRKQI